MLVPGPLAVLLIDDNEDNLLALRAVLQGEWPELEVVATQRPAEGLALAAGRRFDGALVDVQMPELNGIEVCRRLKAIPGNAQLSVILVTSHGSDGEQRARGLQAGADDFINRPVDNAEFVARVRGMVRLRKAEGALLAANERLEDKVAEQTAELRASRDELRELYRHLSAVREDERLAVSREVHDDLGQRLAAAVLELGEIAQGVPSELRASVAALEETLRRSVESVRRICNSLRPEMLDTHGLLPAISWLAESFQRRCGVRCRCHLPEVLPTLPEPVEVALFRIVQECLNNVLQHARAEAVSVSLSIGEDSLSLRVEDNGRGIRPAAVASPRGFGLRGIRERAAAFGGTLSIGPASPGTSIRVQLPLAEDR